MNVSLNMLAHHLDNLLDYPQEHEEFPQQFSIFDPYIEAIHYRAQYFNEEEPLRLGIEYLLTHPEIKLARWVNGEYTFDEQDVQRALAYMHQRLWPQHEPIPPEGPSDVTLVSMPLLEWREVRMQLKAQQEGVRKPPQN